MDDLPDWHGQSILVIGGRAVYLKERSFFEALLPIIHREEARKFNPFPADIETYDFSFGIAVDIATALMREADNIDSISSEESIISRTEASDSMKAASRLFSDYMNCQHFGAFPVATASEQDWVETVKTDLAVMLVAAWREKYQDNNQYLSEISHQIFEQRAGLYHGGEYLIDLFQENADSPKPGYAVSTLDTETLFDDILKYQFRALKRVLSWEIMHKDKPLFDDLDRVFSVELAYKELCDILECFASLDSVDLNGWDPEVTYLVSARCQASIFGPEDLDLALNRLGLMPERKA